MRNKVDKYMVITIAIPLLYCLYYLVQGEVLLKGNSDAIDHHIPFFMAINDAVSTDYIPLWTRFIFTGYSLISFPIWQWYPPNWISFIVAKDCIPITMTITAWLHFIGVAWAAFIYFREISKSSYWASVFAIAYTFSLPVMFALTTIVVQLPGHLFTLLSLYIIHTSANRTWKLNVVYVALTTFAIITGTFVQFFIYFIFLLFLYSIFIGIFGAETNQSNKRITLYCLLGIILGMVLAAPVLLPLITMSFDTSRDFAGMSPSDIYNLIKISPILLWRLFSPNAFGFDISFPNPTVGGINYIESMNAFSGIIALFLSGYAIINKCSSVVIFWLTIFVGILFITMTPLLYLHIILFGNKFILNRITLLLPLAITSLAVIAGQHIDSENKISLKSVLLNPFWIILAIAAIYGIPTGDYMKTEIARGALFLYIVIATGFYLNKNNRSLWHLIVFFLVLIEVVWSGHLMTKVQAYPLMVKPMDYYTYGKSNNPFPLSKDDLEQYRVVLSELEANKAIPFGAKEANQGMIYGYTSPWGYRSVYSSRLSFLLDKLSIGGGEFDMRTVYFKAKPPFDRIADLTSVGYVINPHVVWSVVEDRRKTSLPRASLFYEYESYESREKAVERLKEQLFPLKQKIVLTSNINTTIGPPDPNASVKFIKNGNAHLVIGVETKTPAILLLTDIFDKDWTARIDGKQVDIMEGNIAFRAVYIPIGKHTVEFKYFPPMLRISLLLLLLGMSVCAILLHLHISVPTFKNTMTGDH